MKKSLNLALMMGILIFGACSTQDKNPDGTYTADSKEGKTFFGNVGGKGVYEYCSAQQEIVAVAAVAGKETLMGTFSNDGKQFTEEVPERNKLSFDGAVSGTRGIYKGTYKGENSDGTWESVTTYIGFDYQAGEKNSKLYMGNDKTKLFDAPKEGERPAEKVTIK